MKIQSLPTEVLSLCTQYLSTKEERTSRLVSRAFENAVVNNALTVSIDRQPPLNPLSSQTIPYVHLKDILSKTVYLKTLRGHTDCVRSVIFSSDGKRIATGSCDRTIKIWDAETGECRQTLQGHTHFVESVAFSPDGKIIATGSCDRTIKIWNAETGECRQTLQGHTEVVCPVVFSPDGKIIATGSFDKTIKIWDAETGGCRQTLQGHTDVVSSVAYSPDGKSIATRSFDQTIKIWDAETGECRQILQDHPNNVSSVAFSSDGKRIATGSKINAIEIWSLDATPEEKLISVLLGKSNVTILPEKLRKLGHEKLVKYAIQFITESNFQAIRNQFEDGRGSVFLESNLIFQYVKRMKTMPLQLSFQVLSDFLGKTIAFLEETERGRSGYLGYPNLAETLKYLKTEQQQLLISEPCSFAEES